MNAVQRGQSARLAVPQLASRAAWDARLGSWAAPPYSGGAPQRLRPQWLLMVWPSARATVADFTALSIQAVLGLDFSADAPEARAQINDAHGDAKRNAQHGQSAPLAVPQLAPCASSGSAWWLCAARHSQSEARPLGSQPPPQLLERAASKVVHFTAFGLAGMESSPPTTGLAESSNLGGNRPGPSTTRRQRPRSPARPLPRSTPTTPWVPPGVCRKRSRPRWGSPKAAAAVAAARRMARA